jgi:hypothetical protein
MCMCVCLLMGSLQTLERHLGTVPRDVLALEFSVLAALDFSAHPPAAAVLPHFFRIVASVNRYSNVREYLGERMHAHFFLGAPA